MTLKRLGSIGLRFTFCIYYVSTKPTTFSCITGTVIYKWWSNKVLNLKIHWRFCSHCLKLKWKNNFSIVSLVPLFIMKRGIFSLWLCHHTSDIIPIDGHPFFTLNHLWHSQHNEYSPVVRLVSVPAMRVVVGLVLASCFYFSGRDDTFHGSIFFFFRKFWD